MSKALFVVRPTNAELIEELDTAVGIEIGSDVVKLLDKHPDAFGLYQVTDKAGNDRLTTRDDVVRTEIRQLLYDDKPITEEQAVRIESVLTPYFLLWEEGKWTVEHAVKLHLQRMLESTSAESATTESATA